MTRWWTRWRSKVEKRLFEDGRSSPANYNRVRITKTSFARVSFSILRVHTRVLSFNQRVRAWMHEEDVSHSSSRTRDRDCIHESFDLFETSVRSFNHELLRLINRISFNRVPIYRGEVNIPFPFLFIFRFIRIISFYSFNEDKNSLFVGFFFFFARIRDYWMALLNLREDWVGRSDAIAVSD